MTEDNKNQSGRSRALVGTTWFKVAIVIGLVLGGYAIFGFFAAPRWLRVAATQETEKALGVPLGLGEIRINPFLLKLTVDDISLPDRAVDEPLIALDRLYVDFEAIASLFNRALAFKDIALTGPFARVIILPDKSLNLAALAPQTESAASEPDDDSGLPALWVQKFDVQAGRVNFADRSRRMAPEKTIAPIEFSLRDFRTNPEGGAATLDARSEDGEGFEWAGQIALAPVASQGRFSLTALKARTVWEFLSEELPLELASGSIDLEANYEFELDPQVRLALNVPSLRVSGLELKALDADAPWVRFESIAVTDAAIRTTDQTLAVERLGVRGPAVTAWLEPDGSLNLMRLIEPGNTAAPAANSDSAQTIDAAPPRTPEPDTAVAKPEVEGGEEAASDWTVTLATLDVSDAAIEFEDRTFTPPNPTRLAPLALEAHGLSLDLAQPFDLSFEGVVNDHGDLTIVGDLAPDPLVANLDVAYRGGSLLVGQPYVSRIADLTVRSGDFDVEGQLKLRPEGGDEPFVRFDGQIVATKLQTVDNSEAADLLNFDELAVKGINFTLAPDRVAIDEVSITRPFARVIIAPDQTINVVEVFAGDEQADPAATEQAVAKPGDTAEPEETFPVAIEKIVVKGGTLDFSDFFIQPNFQARIDALNGQVSGMSSDPASKAGIDLKGHVINEYSPVSIIGQMNLFSFDRFTDIDMEFRNIDLPVFNPYSGKFAGYAIAKGKLTTELSYEIDKRELEAQHHIVVDQLEWGEKTESEDAVTIPVKLATALLKDRNGTIDLDFPVGGSLDDPSFKIGPVIWQIVRNLLVKIVTAPFAFIGSLFQGAEDAQYVTFEAGSANLSVDNAQSLAALAKGLYDRPQLRLDVPVRRMPEIDGPALAARRYAAEIETATRAVTGSTQGEPAAAFETLDAEIQVKVLTAVYTALAGSTPTIPESPEPPDGTSRAQARALAQQHEIDYLTENSKALISVRDDELLALAETRAKAVQAALLEGAQIDPERIFITTGDKVSVDGDNVKLELGLE